MRRSMLSAIEAFRNHEVVRCRTRSKPVEKENYETKEIYYEEMRKRKRTANREKMQKVLLTKKEEMISEDSRGSKSPMSD